MGLAAVSYDSEAILKDFSHRKNIDYPLISDSQSEIISAFGVLNPKAAGIAKGVPYPGYVLIAPDGTVKEKFFESAYTDRITANNLLAHLIPELVEESARDLPAPHIKLRLLQTDTRVVPGSIVGLEVRVSLPTGIHVYGPEVSDYKPTKLELRMPPGLSAEKTVYPPSKILLLPAIKETAPVFEGTFTIAQDVVVSAEREFLMSLGTGRILRVAGDLQYQACSNNTCFLPVTVPVSWDIAVEPLDYERSPAALRKR